jgi:hypothetical protein
MSGDDDFHVRPKPRRRSRPRRRPAVFHAAMAVVAADSGVEGRQSGLTADIAETTRMTQNRLLVSHRQENWQGDDVIDNPLRVPS